MSTNRHNESVKRSTLRHQLVYNWCLMHRPDVVELAQAEAAKKYPLTGIHRKQRTPVPKALRTLK
jgi:hypothetical protein